MAQRVFFHVGLPKTGTTYLQTVLWSNRDTLRSQGVLLPGDSVRQHLWASLVVREDPKLERRVAAAKLSWAKLLEAINAWDGTAVVSHEFFAGASTEQVRRVLADLGDAEVHVVVTARDTVSLVTARWQEYVKNGETAAIDDYPATEDTDPAHEWDWGTMDIEGVLARWGADLPPDRVHVITLPKPGDPKDELWLRFSRLLGIDPATCTLDETVHNVSLGVVEVELLRRVNGDLEGFTSALDRGNWIRRYLAQGKLVPRRGEKFWPSPDRVDELRSRSERAVDAIKAAGYDVIGDVDDLRTPVDLPSRRHPDTVTDGELLAAASQTIAEMLTDVRRLHREKSALERQLAEVPEPPPPSGVKKVARRVRRVWSRS